MTHGFVARRRLDLIRMPWSTGVRSEREHRKRMMAKALLDAERKKPLIEEKKP